jgi:hypothetical protein
LFIFDALRIEPTRSGRYQGGGRTLDLSRHRHDAASGANPHYQPYNAQKTKPNSRLADQLASIVELSTKGDRGG